MAEHGVILLGSLRRDGSPRISPVEPVLVDGELELGMIWQSKKALDLLRDPRCQVHTVITDRNGTEGEFKLWGRARDLGLAERERYCVALHAKIGWRPKEPFHASRSTSRARPTAGSARVRRCTPWCGRPAGRPARASRSSKFETRMTSIRAAGRTVLAPSTLVGSAGGRTPRLCAFAQSARTPPTRCARTTGSSARGARCWRGEDDERARARSGPCLKTGANALPADGGARRVRRADVPRRQRLPMR